MPQLVTGGKHVFGWTRVGGRGRIVIPPEGEVTEYKGKPYSWVQLRDGGVTIPPDTLARYEVRTGDGLVVVRGSGLAVSFLVKGPIVEEAGRHPDLEVFEPEETGLIAR